MSSPASGEDISPSAAKTSPATQPPMEGVIGGTPVVKRGRGRPRKYPKFETPDQFADGELSSPADGMSVSPLVAQKSPATQQQNWTETGGSPIVKRGRGRPRKSPRVEASEQVPGVMMTSPADGKSVSPLVAEISPATQQLMTGDSPIVKRGRGRPRKSPRVETSGKVFEVTIPSPADTEFVSPSIAENSPAAQQQNKEEMGGAPVVKRGRGRPRKHPKVETPGQFSDAEQPSPSSGVSPSPQHQSNKEGAGGSPVVKRGRGRPRKYPKVEGSREITDRSTSFISLSSDESAVEDTPPVTEQQGKASFSVSPLTSSTKATTSLALDANKAPAMKQALFTEHATSQGQTTIQDTAKAGTAEGKMATIDETVGCVLVESKKR